MDLFGKYETDEKFISKTKGFLDEFKDKEIILWGKGRIIPTLLKFIDNLNIKYIVDSNKNLHGTFFEGYQILSPEVLQNEDKNKVRIIIAPFDCQHGEIAKTLVKFGFDNKSFCVSQDYLIAYNYLNNNKIVLPSLEFIISSVCSLRCKDCIAKIPYFKQNSFQQIPFKDLKTNIDKIFNSIDYVARFQLATGEVLLHKELGMILEYIATNYRHKYDELTFVTNGTVIPGEDLLETISKYVSFIQISPYTHKDVQKLLKVDELIGLFQKYKINYISSHYATGVDEPQWNDIGDLVTPKSRYDKDNINLYHNCSMHICKCMVHDKLFPCTVACYAAYGRINHPSSDKENRDYIRINDKNINIVRFYLKAMANDFPSICDYCNGVGPYVNKIMVAAGEQIK